MTSDDVAQYLRLNPGFFTEHAELLENIQVPHPHGGRAIPLSDRQVLALREKNRTLETKLAELIQFGEENDAISEKVHRVACALAGAAGLEEAIDALYASLRDDFQVPHTALRFWRSSGTRPEWRTVLPETVAEAERLAHPLCGAPGEREVAGWFPIGREHIRSVGLVPLRSGDTTFGLLALASEDARRFYPEMGTLYLARIGDIAAATFARHL